MAWRNNFDIKNNGFFSGNIKLDCLLLLASTRTVAYICVHWSSHIKAINE